jgi:hypothetical protein
MQDTVKAVKKISAIRQKREAHHILSRLAVSKVRFLYVIKLKKKIQEVQKRADLWEVDTNLKIVQAPAVQDERLKVNKLFIFSHKINCALGDCEAEAE